MTKEINVLYDGNMTKLIRESYDFRGINRDAEELAQSKGSAVVIRIRENLPKIGFSTINVLRYSKFPKIAKSKRLYVPTSLLELIAETYKK
ncbi:MAG: hypothetical protein AABY06_02775 [Nanoarchaeota archaeon]